MSRIDAYKWRAASNAAFHGGEHRYYQIGRGNSMNSETKGPHLLRWEDCIVAAAMVNGHRTEEAIRAYAAGYADVDPAALDDAVGRLREGIELTLRRYGWDLPEPPAAEDEAPGPGPR